jgi:protoporphyrinogen oxidase
MLLRQRKSRIYFLRRFFEYPIQINGDTIKKLGLLRVAGMGFSYLWAMAFPTKNPENLEQFFINRFGKQLYLTFFKSYTEKVWGQPCTKISAAWGDQRIKGLSITKAVMHFLRSALGSKHRDVAQKGTETSLIEQFLYPKLGPGQMWEIAAQEVQRGGGEVHLEQQVTKLHVADGRVTAVDARNTRTGEITTYSGDWFFSTMPVKDLIHAMATGVPENVRGGRGASLSRLHYRGPAGQESCDSRRPQRRRGARQLDLYSRARRAGRPLANL